MPGLPWSELELAILESHLSEADKDKSFNKIVDDIALELEFFGINRSAIAIKCKIKNEYNYMTKKKAPVNKVFPLKRVPSTSPFRPYDQSHIDTAHWMYERYRRIYPKSPEERIVELVSQDMNFTPERMEEILSHPPRKVVGE